MGIFSINRSCRRALARDCGNACHKWACSDVIVTICVFEWCGEERRVSYCQVLWISHTSCALGFDHISSVLTGHCLSITWFFFSLPRCICHSLCIFFPPISSIPIISCLRIHSLLPPLNQWSPRPDPVALHSPSCRDPLAPHCCPSVATLFLVNLSESFPPRSWQVCVVGSDSRQSSLPTGVWQNSTLHLSPLRMPPEQSSARPYVKTQTHVPPLVHMLWVQSHTQICTGINYKTHTLHIKAWRSGKNSGRCNT